MFKVTTHVWKNFRILARWNKPSQKISIPACPMTVDKATPCLHAVLFHVDEIYKT